MTKVSNDVSEAELKILRALRTHEFRDETKFPTLGEVRRLLGQPAQPAQSVAANPGRIDKLIGLAKIAMARVSSPADGALENTLTDMQSRGLVYAIPPVNGTRETTYRLGSAGRHHVMCHCPELRNLVAYEQATLRHH